MQNSVHNKFRDWCKTTPQEIADVMLCPWFDDCDITATKDPDSRDKYAGLRKWRDELLDRVDESLAKHGEDVTKIESPSWQILRMITETYQVIGDMRARYERAFGVSISSSDEAKPWFYVIVDDLDTQKYSIANMSQDISTMEQYNELHLHFYCNRNVFLGMRDVGMLDCLIPHESVHIWECIDTWNTGGRLMLTEKNGTHQTQALEYDRLHGKYAQQVSADTVNQYHHPVWGTELYSSMIERKRLYSDTIDWERHVTEFHMADSGLTYDEALELAHSTFFDLILGLLWREDIDKDPNIYEDIIETVGEELDDVAPAVHPIFNRWYQNLMKPQVAVMIAHMKASLSYSDNRELEPGTMADKIQITA